MLKTFVSHGNKNLSFFGIYILSALINSEWASPQQPLSRYLLPPLPMPKNVDLFPLGIWFFDAQNTFHFIALCVLCSVGSSVLKKRSVSNTERSIITQYRIQSDRIPQYQTQSCNRIAQYLIHIFDAYFDIDTESSESSSALNTELSDCSVSTTELSDRSCIWYWVAFGRKFQF